MRPLLFVWALSVCRDDRARWTTTACWMLPRHLRWSTWHHWCTTTPINQSPVRRGACATRCGEFTPPCSRETTFWHAQTVLPRLWDGIASLMRQAIELTCEGESHRTGRLISSRSYGAEEYLSHICRKTAPSLVGAAYQAGAIMGGGGPLLEKPSPLWSGAGMRFSDSRRHNRHNVAGRNFRKTQFNDLRRAMDPPPHFRHKVHRRRHPPQGMCRRSISTQDILLVKKACLEEGCIDRARQSALLLAEQPNPVLSRSRLLTPRPPL